MIHQNINKENYRRLQLLRIKTQAHRIMKENPKWSMDKVWNELTKYFASTAKGDCSDHLILIAQYRGINIQSFPYINMDYEKLPRKNRLLTGQNMPIQNQIPQHV